MFIRNMLHSKTYNQEITLPSMAYILSLEVNENVHLFLLAMQFS